MCGDHHITILYSSQEVDRHGDGTLDKDEFLDVCDQLFGLGGKVSLEFNIYHFLAKCNGSYSIIKNE